MPRGRKPVLTLEEQLEQVTNEINTLETKLEELKNKKQELESQIKMNRLTELDAMITQKGLSLDDMRKLLDK